MTTETFYLAAGGKPTITKDPNAVLDYTVDFTGWLATMGDTIVSHTVTTVGVIKDSSSVAAGKAVVMWISGGAAGSPASATVRVTTTGGRTDDRTVYFKIKER